MGFSPDGSKLASVDSHGSHKLAVIDVETGAVVAQSDAGDAKIFNVAWSSESMLVTVGVSHIQFWRYDQTGTLTAEPGQWQPTSEP